ncbi:5-formyltetrahydrofolate cyclo-ligase [cyanobiont of Ornithocercus magnificus]|nr:5-formyltetrahydrofolate cyclo-ligase [cyanobiont of Ornithocercus magnificus]
MQVHHYLRGCIANGLQGWVGIYWPLPGEADLRPLCQISQLHLALPGATPNHILRYHPWVRKNKESSLKADFCGIPAPLSQPCLKPEQISLVLVPAIALDQHAIRLGYGGGYYDRLRSTPRWSKVFALAVLPQACLTSVLLPADSWDLPFNGWITERGTTLINWH